MELDKFIGFRLKDAMEQFEKLNISKYAFDITKEPRRGSTPMTPNFRILRISEENDGTVRILLCADD